MGEEWQVGGITPPLHGCFTKQLVLQGRTLRDIELILGYHMGRLSEGAWFAAAVRLPEIDNFELAGYTQVAGHHTVKQYGDLNNPGSAAEKETYTAMKKMAMNSWKTFGTDRLIKVLPSIRHSSHMEDDVQYPPGHGVPQWNVKKGSPLSCRLISFVKDYPDGRFIPEEGYTAVRYF